MLKVTYQIRAFVRYMNLISPNSESRLSPCLCSFPIKTRAVFNSYVWLNCHYKEALLFRTHEWMLAGQRRSISLEVICLFNTHRGKVQGLVLLYLGSPSKIRNVVAQWPKFNWHPAQKSFSNLAGYWNHQGLYDYVFIHLLCFYLFTCSYRFSSVMTEQQNRNLCWQDQGICIGLMFWGNSDLQSVFGLTAFVEGGLSCLWFSAVA